MSAIFDNVSANRCEYKRYFEDDWPLPKWFIYLLFHFLCFSLLVVPVWYNICFIKDSTCKGRQKQLILPN